MTVIGSTQKGTDNQSGYFNIPENLTILVEENKQMICFGTMTVDGFLVVDGNLILEP